MTEFTPIQSILGGMIIGTSAMIMLLGIGRIAGISGIVGGLLSGGESAGDRGWRVAFVIGLLSSAFIYVGYVNNAIEFDLDAPTYLVVIGGLLVGYGTRLGSGCTSGHGVCGLARLSPRSITATATFMFTAVVTVFVLRHVLELV